MRETFNRVADRITRVVGTPVALLMAALVIVVWAVTGPIAGFSDTWQLIINTGTTIVTFLMVFVIQNTQNRDSKAVHAKLDELLRASKDARNELIRSEQMPEHELDQTLDELAKVAGQEVGGSVTAEKKLEGKIEAQVSRRTSARSSSSTSPRDRAA